MGLTCREWLETRFGPMDILPQEFEPCRVTLILGGDYPAFSAAEGERLVRLAARLNCNLTFNGGKVLVPKCGQKKRVAARPGGAREGAIDVLARSVLLRHMKNGVKFFGTENVYIDAGVKIERGAEIYAPCRICGSTVISAGARVISSTLQDSHVGRGTCVGPYSYLRGGTYVGDNCRIGDFVELKNARLGDGVKVAHLAYVGDALLGDGVNVGCGAVFANYDGKTKQVSRVDDDCFIGCNCNIVAPVHLHRGCYVAAGTTVTQDICSEALCIGRVRERTIEKGAAGRYKNG